jgi:hypothetical protein
MVNCFLMELKLSESDRDEARACLSHCDWNLQEAVPAARAIEDTISKLRVAKMGGWLTWDEYYRHYVHELSERNKSESSFADLPPAAAPTYSPDAALTLQCATRCWLSRRAFAEELSTFEDQNSFADHFARAANASAAAAHAGEAQGGSRKLSFDATAALLEALALDGSIVTFIAYNDFGYKGRYAVPKAEREYWLKISKDKLPTSLREKFPGLLVADDLVIMHVHYEGDYPWPGNPSRPKVPLQPARMVITQINVRHTWQGSGKKPSFPCEDPGGALHGLIKESSGQAVLVADTGWHWKDTKEKRKSFGSCKGKHTACLQDLLEKGENYADHGGRKVRKKFFGLAQSPSDDGTEDGMGLKSSAAGGAMEWTVTEWSARTVPVPVRRPFKILFVGVNENERIKSQLDLKREQRLIQDMIYKYFRDISPKPEFKPIPHGSWGLGFR